MSGEKNLKNAAGQSTANGSVTNPNQIISDPKRRRILYAVCIALMAVIASVTGLNVAQPHLVQA